MHMLPQLSNIKEYAVLIYIDWASSIFYTYATKPNEML